MIEKYFAEFETDKVVREMFFPGVTSGVMVEVGAASPDFLSMSQHFRSNGWRCICVDPNPTFARMHRERGNEIHEIACSDVDADGQVFEIAQIGELYGAAITEESFSAIKIRDGYKARAGFHGRVIPVKVDVRRLDTLLASLNVPAVDYLSVDVEGWELEVMRGLTVNPRVVVLENFLHLPAYTQYMQERGFKQVRTVHYNYVFSLE